MTTPIPAKALALPALSAEGSLSQYFREAWKFPILEHSEERALAERWRDNGDTEAAHSLVTSHLRLVCKIAMGYRGYGLPVADLISEGNIGLMKAVKKFEPEKGFRLSTYAMWWIKASITEYVLKSWSMVKMGTVAAQKKLFFSLRKHKKALGINDTGELDMDQAQALSERLDISTRDIIHMNRRISSRDLSLNAPIGDENRMEYQDTLVSETVSPEEFTADAQERGLHSNLLAGAMDVLDERERHIFTERRLKDDPVTLEVLGQSYGISRERVRQLEARAFKKVQEGVLAAMEGHGGVQAPLPVS